MTKKTLMAVFAVAAAVAPSARQAGAPPADKAPQFEVAAIKPNKSGDGRVMIGLQPGGRFTAANVTLRMLIRNAYQLQDFQIAGGPEWMSSDHYDINAKAEDGAVAGPPPPPGQPGPIQLMLRALLAERFKLAAHTEDREMPIFALVLNRPDGRLGPQLKSSELNCEAARGRGRGPGGPPPDPSQQGVPQCGMRIAMGNLVAGGMRLSDFANAIGNLAGRIVVDKTGLIGTFDFTLTWTPDNLPQRPPGAPEPLVNGVPIDPNGPSLFTAVQEQLGLKLDSQKAPVKVLVVDRAEKPVEN